MPHVGVERFGSGDAKKDTTEYGKAFETPVNKIGQRVARIEAQQHRRILRDAPNAR